MGCTGIEPVTSSMSTKRSPAELTAHKENFINLFKYVILV